MVGNQPVTSQRALLPKRKLLPKLIQASRPSSLFRRPVQIQGFAGQVVGAELQDVLQFVYGRLKLLIFCRNDCARNSCVQIRRVCPQHGFNIQPWPGQPTTPAVRSAAWLVDEVTQLDHDSQKPISLSVL